jgi:hypothetical protein
VGIKPNWYANHASEEIGNLDSFDVCKWTKLVKMTTSEPIGPLADITHWTW